jgi:putative oxidoreductase
MRHVTCKDTAMSQKTSPLLIAAGRWLVGLYFFVPGILKFLAFDMHVALMTAHKVPFPAPLLIIAGCVNIAGALLLFSNRFVRFTALGFGVYILIINLSLHDFWHYDGLVGAHEMQNFIKNLGILAGLLVLAGSYAWRMPSLKGLATSDAAV